MLGVLVSLMDIPINALDTLANGSMVHDQAMRRF